MRILVLGAGGVGGYFGGRLLAAGRDVTFLVRPRRAAQLAETGLIIRSPLGDLSIPNPPTILAEAIREPFDLVLLTCKAYDFDAAVASIAPAVGPRTTILPLLNGMRHLDWLDERFGAEAVLGGFCVVTTTLDAEGRVLHLGELHSLTFGERDGSSTPRVKAVEAGLTGAGFDARLSPIILQEMWEKWVFIATAAGITCLMRATIGDIVQAGAEDLVHALLEECGTIAGDSGFPPRDEPIQRNRAMLTKAGSPLVASMARDIERGGATEGEHLLGDLLRRRKGTVKGISVLRVAYAHLRAYEARRAREAAA